MARRHGLMQNDVFVMGFLDLGVFLGLFSPGEDTDLLFQIRQ